MRIGQRTTLHDQLSGVTSDQHHAPPVPIIETFETAIIGAETFNTGVLAATPVLALVFGVAASGTGLTLPASSFMGFATGTGAAAKSAGTQYLNPGAGSDTDVVGDSDSIGGWGSVSQGDKLTAWRTEDLNVTVFSEAGGITLDWSAVAIGFSQIKLVVIEF